MSKPIRVLHVVTTMNRGGLETMLMNYYRNINRHNVQFDFLIHRQEESDYEQEILKLGGKTYHISNLNPFSISYRRELSDFFKEHGEYKIVHCHLDCMSSIPLYYAKRAGIQTRIAHSHNASQDKNIKYLLKLFYKTRIPKMATHLFACGIEAGEWMFGNHKYEVINNAINAKDFLYDSKKREQLRNELNLQDKFVLGHVGRFNEQKNHEFIIDIFNQILKLNDKAHLLLVGEGNLKESMIEKVQSLGVSDKVTFFGLCNHVEEMLQAFDVFLFPSLYEGLPVTMVEAQASGLNCFISNKVPKECIITTNVTVLNLSDLPQKWAKEINKYSNGYERKNTLLEIKDKRFDIEENALELERFYLNQY